MLDGRLRQYLDSRRENHLAMLKAFIRFPSVSAQSEHLADCIACARWLRDHLSALGFDARVDDAVPHPVVVAHGPVKKDRPTLLVYGHYDVQPAEPLELWTTAPFEPTIRGGDLFARGTSDDKGPLFTWIMAAEAWRQIAGELPVNMIFLIEGEEETGSPALEKFIEDNRAELACDTIAISDTGFPAEDKPAITTSVRGIVYVEVTITCANRDLHSGLYGGAAPTR